VWRFDPSKEGPSFQHSRWSVMVTIRTTLWVQQRLCSSCCLDASQSQHNVCTRRCDFSVRRTAMFVNFFMAINPNSWRAQSEWIESGARVLDVAGGRSGTETIKASRAAMHWLPPSCMYVPPFCGQRPHANDLLTHDGQLQEAAGTHPAPWKWTQRVNVSCSNKYYAVTIFQVASQLLACHHISNNKWWFDFNPNSQWPEVCAEMGQSRPWSACSQTSRADWIASLTIVPTWSHYKKYDFMWQCKICHKITMFMTNFMRMFRSMIKNVHH
jgi:hypothetical protein